MLALVKCCRVGLSSFRRSLVSEKGGFGLSRTKMKSEMCVLTDNGVKVCEGMCERVQITPH